MEENKKENHQETENNQNESSSQSNFKQWLQDNLRIIISIVIVVAIAGGVYSYSKRTNSARMQPNPDELALEIEKDSSEEISDSEEAIEATEDEDQQPAEEAETPKQEVAQPQQNTEEKTSSASTSQETENSFVETAGRGDGATHLARRALANYLEKNPDSSLTAEHKIYIEDYLRKNASQQGRIAIGTSMEFSKDLIKNAIEKAKGLNEGQLQNLHKYVVRVPSLS